jgi:hypothetical protein
MHVGSLASTLAHTHGRQEYITTDTPHTRLRGCRCSSLSLTSPAKMANPPKAGLDAVALQDAPHNTSHTTSIVSPAPAAPALFRPITPYAISPTWFEEANKAAPSGEGASGAACLPSGAQGDGSKATRGGGVEFLLEDGCPCCGARPKRLEMLAAPLMSVLRRLSPMHYRAVMQVVSVSGDCAEARIRHGQCGCVCVFCFIRLTGLVL